jgi:hypothetical protein
MKLTYKEMIRLEKEEAKAKRAAEKAAYAAAEELKPKAPNYYDTLAATQAAEDALIATMPATFSDAAEQAAWCAANGVAVIDHNSYCVKNFGNDFRANAAMSAALRVVATPAVVAVVAETLPVAPVSGVLHGVGRGPSVGQSLTFQEGEFVVTKIQHFRIDDTTASLRGSGFLGNEGERGFSATLEKK